MMSKRDFNFDTILQQFDPKKCVSVSSITTFMPKLRFKCLHNLLEILTDRTGKRVPNGARSNRSKHPKTK